MPELLGHKAGCLPLRILYLDGFTRLKDSVPPGDQRWALLWVQLPEPRRDTFLQGGKEGRMGDSKHGEPTQLATILCNKGNQKAVFLRDKGTEKLAAERD